VAAVTEEDLAAQQAVNDGLRVEIEETRRERELREKAAVNQSTLDQLTAEETRLRAELLAARAEVEALPDDNPPAQAPAPAKAAAKNEKE